MFRKKMSKIFRFFLAYVSDDFKTTKKVKKYIFLKKMLEFFSQKPVVHYWYAVDANLFQLRLKKYEQNI